MKGELTNAYLQPTHANIQQCKFYNPILSLYRLGLFKILSENGRNLQEFEESAGKSFNHTMIKFKIKIQTKYVLMNFTKLRQFLHPNFKLRFQN
jgi:hypothetical protein